MLKVVMIYRDWKKKIKKPKVRKKQKYFSMNGVFWGVVFEVYLSLLEKSSGFDLTVFL